MRWTLAAAFAALGVSGDVPGEAIFVPCVRMEGEVLAAVPHRECVDLLPPERIRGTWFLAIEESTFLPAGRPLPAVRTFSWTETPPEWETWLDVGWPRQLELLEGVPVAQGEGDTLRYAVEFIGRRARRPGQHGHGGMSPRLIVVDRMLSIRPAGRVRTRVDLPEPGRDGSPGEG